MVFLTYFNLSLNTACFCLSLVPDHHPALPVGVEQKHTIGRPLPWFCAWLFTCLAVWLWSSPLISVFSSGNWAPWWQFHLIDCMCACWEQVALRGLSGFLSLEQIWIILPPGEKEIFRLEVMAAISKVKYWFKPNDIYLWNMTQNSEWDNASVSWAPKRAKDYWLRLLPSSALPVSLSLSTASLLKSHCKESHKGSWSLFSFPHLQHSNK